MTCAGLKGRCFLELKSVLLEVGYIEKWPKFAYLESKVLHLKFRVMRDRVYIEYIETSYFPHTCAKMPTPSPTHRHQKPGSQITSLHNSALVVNFTRTTLTNKLTINSTNKSASPYSFTPPTYPCPNETCELTNVCCPNEPCQLSNAPCQLSNVPFPMNPVSSQMHPVSSLMYPEVAVEEMLAGPPNWNVQASSTQHTTHVSVTFRVYSVESRNVSFSLYQNKTSSGKSERIHAH